jgi:hypothetical protein
MPPLFEASNRGPQYVDYSKERKNQMKYWVKLCNRKSASDQLEKENQDSLYAFIPKSMGLSQSN